jgi:hypothetical protein
VFSQFGRPRGVPGISPPIIDRRPSNLERNEWALSLLAIRRKGLNDSRIRNKSCLEGRQRLPSQ